MGKLMRMAGRVFGAGVLVLAGAGVPVLAGAGMASAQPASTGTCQQITTTLNNLDVALKTHSGAADKEIATAASQLTQEASAGTATLQRAVSTFVTDLRAAAAGHLNTGKFTTDGKAVLSACAAQATAPNGAPATGGSAVGVQDPALFGVGGAAVLAGVGVLGLAARRRPRGSTSQG